MELKMEKRIIAIFTAIILISISLTAFADADSITVDQITVDGSDLTVDFTTNLTGEDQVTLLTYKADSAETEATIPPGTVRSTSYPASWTSLRSMCASTAAR